MFQLFDGFWMPGESDTGDSRAGTSTDQPVIGGYAVTTDDQPNNTTNSPLGVPPNRTSETGTDASPEAFITSFLNQVLSNLSPHGTRIQLQVSRDPNYIKLVFRSFMSSLECRFLKSFIYAQF